MKKKTQQVKLSLFGTLIILFLGDFFFNWSEVVLHIFIRIYLELYPYETRLSVEFEQLLQRDKFLMV